MLRAYGNRAAILSEYDRQQQTSSHLRYIRNHPHLIYVCQDIPSLQHVSQINNYHLPRTRSDPGTKSFPYAVFSSAYISIFAILRTSTFLIENMVDKVSSPRSSVVEQLLTKYKGHTTRNQRRASQFEHVNHVYST